MNLSKVYGVDTHTKLFFKMDPSRTINRKYILLDSRYLDYYLLDEKKQLKWWFTTTSLSNQDGSINIQDHLSDIKKITIHPFLFPKLSKFLVDYNMFHIGVEELRNLFEYSRIDRTYSTQFIMITTPIDNTNTSQLLKIDNLDEDDTNLVLEPPLNYLHSLTITLHDGFRNLIEQNFVTKINKLTVGATTTFTTVTTAPSVGQSVVIENFATTSLNDQSIVNSINATHTVTASTTNTFTIAINTTTLVGSMLGEPIVYYVGYNFVLPVEIEYHKKKE